MSQLIYSDCRPVLVYSYCLSLNSSLISNLQVIVRQVFPRKPLRLTTPLLVWSTLQLPNRYTVHKVCQPFHSYVHPPFYCQCPLESYSFVNRLLTLNIFHMFKLLLYLCKTIPFSSPVPPLYPFARGLLTFPPPIHQVEGGAHHHFSSCTKISLLFLPAVPPLSCLLKCSLTLFLPQGPSFFISKGSRWIMIICSLQEQ